MALARVLIVDDDKFVMTTLQHALAGMNIEVVGCASRPQDGLEIAIASQVDVALLDLDLGPGANGIDLAHALRKQQPNIGIVILTSYTDPRISDPSSRSLPKGTIFLTKSKIDEMSTLISAIVSAKQSPLHAGRKNAPLMALSDKQISVLILLSQGLTTTEIAKMQSVGEKAIESTITKLHRQLELPKSGKLNTRVQLVRAYYSLRGKDL
jgi:two-component system invasion response regulator UvrY